MNSFEYNYIRTLVVKYLDSKTKIYLSKLSIKYLPPNLNIARVKKQFLIISKKNKKIYQKWSFLFNLIVFLKVKLV